MMLIQSLAGESLRTQLPLRPRSKVRIFWEVLGMFLLFCDVIWLPLQAFEIPPSVAFSTLQTIFWTLDIPSGFLTGYYKEDGKLDLKFANIASRYSKSWLLPDLLLVGNDWVVSAIMWLGVGGNSQYGSLMRTAKAAKLARNLRCLRLLRIAKLREVLLVCFQNICSEGSSLLLEMALSAFSCVLLNHFVACLWFHLGKMQSEDSWIQKHGVESADVLAQYFYSFHWSLTQFTPASMEVFPCNTKERIFTVVVILFAMLTFSSFVSSISSGMTRLRMMKSERSKPDFALRSFLRDNRISRSLSIRITRHVSMAIKMNRKFIPMEEVQQLRVLPVSMHLALQTELYSPWLNKHPFFNKYLTMDPEAVRELFTSVLQRQAYAAHDLVFKRGDLASQMHFVTRGLLRYQLPGGDTTSRSQFLPLEEGSWLSEAALWLPWVHRGPATVLLDSEVAILNAKKFAKLTIKYPDTYDLARTRAHVFLNMLMSEKHNVHDAPQDSKRREATVRCSQSMMLCDNAVVSDYDAL